MGAELACRARFGKEVSEGKALLETRELIFRGEFRLKIGFEQMKSVKAVDGELRIEFPKGRVTLELGRQAEKWAQKILHPKSRIEKLGIRPETKVSLLGEFEKEFAKELEEVTRAVTRGRVTADAECIFLRAETTEELERCAKIGRALKGATALWMVYPKGRREIGESGVIAAGRNAGLKDVKVVAFSATHTALKFVVPLAQR